MKTRIIQTRFWADGLVTELAANEKLVFIYLLSNEAIGLTGAYECTINTIAFDTGLSAGDVRSALVKLKRSITYKNGWVVVKNAHKYNNYTSNSKQQKAYQTEFDRLPVEIRAIVPTLSQVLSGKDTSTILVPNTSPKSKDINPKSKIKRRKKKTEENTGEVLTEKTVNAKWLLDVWNYVFGTSLRSTVAIEDNLDFWLQHYSKDEIKQAVVKARQDKYWQNIINPEIFLRQRNERKERVDRISSFLNRKAVFDSANTNLR